MLYWIGGSCMGLIAIIIVIVILAYEAIMRQRARDYVNTERKKDGKPPVDW